MALQGIVVNPDSGLRDPAQENRLALRPAEDGQSRKVRVTVSLPRDLVEQVRDAVYWTPGLTLAWLIARAMSTSLAELHESNQGPFPRRSNQLRAGRPRLTGQSMRIHAPFAAPRKSPQSRDTSVQQDNGTARITGQRGWRDAVNARLNTVRSPK
jgi:hypothetical protein